MLRQSKYSSLLIALTICLYLLLIPNKNAADNIRALSVNSEQHAYNRFNPIGALKQPIIKLGAQASNPAMTIAKPSTTKPVPFELNSRGELFLYKLPTFQNKLQTTPLLQGIGTSGDVVQFTTNPILQEFVQNLMRTVNAPHASILVMEPKTGKILALAEKSSSLESTLQHSGFPAASLFKVVTSAAAIERAKLGPNTIVKFRGGNYQLDRTNYRPSDRYDRLSLPLGKALGKSTNAVFARVAMKYLTPQILSSYANSFGFNTDLKFDMPIRESSAFIPTDPYEYGRTAAGFGKVYMSPIHAASFMSAVANGGSLPRPHLIKQVNSKAGTLLYQSYPATLKTAFSRNTGPLLMEMMTNSVTSGTSRYAFYNRGRPVLPGIRVSGKTGTLRGKNPAGLNRWFIGAAPANNPEIVVIAHSINPRNSLSRPSSMASRVLVKHFSSKNRK